MRESFETMGTVASVALDLPTSIEPARAVFAAYDAVFSLYRPDSPLSALARGELTLSSAPDIVKDEYARALGWRAATGGWFTPHRPDGVIDLSGTIKAVAIQRAGEELAASGAAGFLGVGGDIVVIGRPHDLSVGISDPGDRSRMLTRLDLGARRAIATSGVSERGAHIWSRSRANDIVQATVLADDIVTADVLATALVAAGADHVDELTTAFDVDALLVLDDQTLRATPGLDSRVIVSSNGRATT